MATEASGDELGVELRRAVARFYRRLIAERADDQLSDTQGAVLSLIVREGPRTINALSEHERVTPPSMNQVVNALVARGYAERQRDEVDRRRVLVSPTAAGAEVAHATIRHRHEWMHGQLERLTTGERKALARAATLMRRMADE